MKSYIKITFDVNTNDFNYQSDMNKSGVVECVEFILTSHLGAGADNSKPNMKDLYTIYITWEFLDDSFIISSDTNNKSLTDGILSSFFQNLTKPYYKK